MKNNGNNNGNGHNGNGFVATVEAIKTNGNGSKAVETEKPATPVESFDEVKRAVIVPRFDQLTPRGVEMFRNMGNLENAKLWANDYAMRAEHDTTEIGGLIMLLEAIKEKCEAGDKGDAPEDFIYFLQLHLFSLTMEFDAASEAFVESVKSGNFVVERFVTPGTGEIEENVDFRTRETTQTVEEFPSLIEADEAEEDDAPEEADDFSEQLKQHHLSIVAKQISHVLKSDKVSNGTKLAFKNIIFDAGNEAGLGVDDPDLITLTLPKIIGSLDFQYGKGILHSLNSILDDLSTDEIGDELRQYEGRLEPLKPVNAAGDTESLAQHISAILKHPDIPAEIYDLLSDELGGGRGAGANILEEVVESPEYISRVLTNLKEEDAAEKMAA